MKEPDSPLVSRVLQHSDLACKDVSSADQGSAKWWSNALCCAVRILLTPTTFFAAWLIGSVTAPATSTVTSLFPTAVAAEMVLSVLDDSFESLCSATTKVLSYACAQHRDQTTGEHSIKPLFSMYLLHNRPSTHSPKWWLTDVCLQGTS